MQTTISWKHLSGRRNIESLVVGVVNIYYFCMVISDMNEKIKLFVPQPAGSFQDRLNDLGHQVESFLAESGLSQENIFWSRIYLSDAANQLEDVLNHNLYQEILV